MTIPVRGVTAPDAALRRPVLVRVAWLLAGSGVLALLVVASVAFGNRVVSFDEVVAGLLGGTDGVGEAAVVARLPRTVLAILVGAALALAGTAFQAVTRNPLADPGILGVTSGASLAVVDTDSLDIVKRLEMPAEIWDVTVMPAKQAGQPPSERQTQ